MPIIFDRETLADDKELLNRFFDQEMPDTKASQRNEKTYIENLMKEDENLSRNEARKQLGYNEIKGCDDLIVPFTNIKDNTIGKQKEKSEKESENKNDINIKDE